MQPKGLAKGLWDDCTSRRRTVTFGSSDSLAATTAPAEPPPITMKSYAIISKYATEFTTGFIDPKIRSTNISKFHQTGWKITLLVRRSSKSVHNATVFTPSPASPHSNERCDALY